MMMNPKSFINFAETRYAESLCRLYFFVKERKKEKKKRKKSMQKKKEREKGVLYQILNLPRPPCPVLVATQENTTGGGQL